MKRRYKNDANQKQFEIAVSKTYPMTFAKDRIGGQLAFQFNAGYEGRRGGMCRHSRVTAASIFYQAGKARKRIDQE